jgi:hypothetical protein
MPSFCDARCSLVLIITTSSPIFFVLRKPIHCLFSITNILMDTTDNQFFLNPNTSHFCPFPHQLGTTETNRLRRIPTTYDGYQLLTTDINWLWPIGYAIIGYDGWLFLSTYDVERLYPEQYVDCNAYAMPQLSPSETLCSSLSLQNLYSEP